MAARGFPRRKADPEGTWRQCVEWEVELWKGKEWRGQRAQGVAASQRPDGEQKRRVRPKAGAWQAASAQDPEGVEGKDASAVRSEGQKEEGSGFE